MIWNCAFLFVSPNAYSCRWLRMLLWCRLRNDLHCVGWGILVVKLYSLCPSTQSQYFYCTNSALVHRELHVFSLHCRLKRLSCSRHVLWNVADADCDDCTVLSERQAGSSQLRAGQDGASQVPDHPVPAGLLRGRQFRRCEGKNEVCLSSRLNYTAFNYTSAKFKRSLKSIYLRWKSFKNIHNNDKKKKNIDLSEFFLADIYIFYIYTIVAFYSLYSRLCCSRPICDKVQILPSLITLSFCSIHVRFRT